MNTAMWLKALFSSPRITRQEWNSLDFISRFLLASRSAVLVLSFSAALIAGLLVMRIQQVERGAWGLFLTAVVFTHAACSLASSLMKQPSDKPASSDTPRESFADEKQLKSYTVFASGIALLAVVLLAVFYSGWPALLLFLLAAGLALLPSLAFPKTDFSELNSLVLLGPAVIAGGFYLLTAQFNVWVLLVGLIFALGPLAVSLGKHLDTFELDRAAQVNTLPGLIGEKATRILSRACFAAQYLLVLYLIVTGFLTRSILVVFLATLVLARPARLYLLPKPAEEPENFKGVWPFWFSPAVFNHARAYGLCFIAGLLLEFFS